MNVLCEHDQRKVVALLKTIKMRNSIRTLLIEKLDRMYTLREAAMPFPGDPLPVELLQMPCSTQGQIRIFPTTPTRKIIQPPQPRFTWNRNLRRVYFQEWRKLVRYGSRTGLTLFWLSLIRRCMNYSTPRVWWGRYCSHKVIIKYVKKIFLQFICKKLEPCKPYI